MSNFVLPRDRSLIRLFSEQKVPVNCVRKHLSQLKGGDLTRLAAPADLHTLILSDVIGDDVSAIASGLTVADPTTFDRAIAVLKPVWQQVPEIVRQHIEAGKRGEIPETPKEKDPSFAFNGSLLLEER